MAGIPVLSVFIGILMKIQQSGFAHAFIRKINDKAVTARSVIAHLNLLLSQVNGTFKLGRVDGEDVGFTDFSASFDKKLQYKRPPPNIGHR